MQHKEELEAQALFTWVTLNEAAYPELALFFAVPNGGKRNKFEAYRLKRTGVRAGVSDYILLAARGGYYGLALELKVGKNKLTDSQEIFFINAIEAGYKTAVCYGAEAAIEELLHYLRMPPT